MPKKILNITNPGERLDIFIANQYPDFTRSSLSVLFKNGSILVNGEAAKPSHIIKSTDNISIDDSYLHQEIPSIDLPVVHQDENVIVINKPAGILSHSKGALNSEASVASFISKHINDESMEGNKAGIVHRLDRATSGIMITALNQDTVSKLQKQFSNRTTKKHYLAIVAGEPEPHEALIDAPILRNPSKPQTFKVDSNGKSAQTEYEVIKTFVKDDKIYSLISLKPRTGRTHQLRVHMSYINHPIVGDSMYGNGDGNLMLHAESLEITIPEGQRRVFKSDMPERFIKFLENN